MAIHKVDGVDGNNHFPKKFVTLYASAACTAGMFVALTADDTNGLGASCANAPLGAGAATASGLVFGIATETVASGATVTVQTAGKYENAYVATGADFGIALIGPLSGGTIGMASVRTAATLNDPVVAVALEDDAVTNYADVMVVDQGFF
tara:strand:- start:1224 stop:1673 length:450 start_codon:yes stop_codon:yes gene_type:complete